MRHNCRVVSVQSLSHVWFFVTPWTAARQASLSITSSRSLLTLMFIESIMLSNQLFLCHLLLLLPSILPSIRVFPMSQSFISGGQSIGVSASASVLQWTLRTDFLSDELVGSPCSPRDSQESSPIPQFKSINSSALSFFFIVQISHHTWPLKKP